MTKKITIFFIFVTLLITTSALGQLPSILWKFNTHDMSFGNAAVGDLDGDGKPEIAFSCYWGDSNMYVLNAEDGSLLWKKNMGGCNDAAPILYDVDNNGTLDVILGSSCNPVITCFKGKDGSIKWQNGFGGTDSPPSIADIDGDGKPEILVGDFEGYLNCFTVDSGNLKWRIPVDTNSAIEASPALVDVNKDGHPDIIVCTWGYGGSGDSSAVYAYDGMTHKLLWKNPTPTNYIYHGAAFADVNNDGIPDLAVSSYDGNVYLLKGSDGSIEWTYPTSGLAYIGDPVTIGDIDNDGSLDMVFINGNGEVDALDNTGHLKWNFIMPLYESSFRGAALADVNNDDTLDVIFATTSGKLYALNGARGNELWNINLRQDYGDSNFGLEHGPVVTSFKQDDTLDVFVVGGYTDYPTIQNDFGRAYAIKVGKGTGPDWLMFQHDYTRSNCVCNPSPASVNEVKQSSINVKDYPNPFSQNITINIALEKADYVSVVIYNMEGMPVRTFANSDLHPGSYQYIWNGESEGGAKLPDGVYYCRISAGNNITVKKIVLIR